MSKLNKVVIVGRANVGKSTLFNRISTSVKSITFDYPGVTRDYIKDVVDWQGHSFELIDSGGIIPKSGLDQLSKEVIKSVQKLMDSGDIILFVCDATVGVVNEDLEIVKYLRKLGKKVFIVANKSEGLKAKANIYEFNKLSYPVFPISALHGQGIADLLEAIVENITVKKTQDAEEPNYKVVLLGKPNVGKSSLMNLLLNEERSLISEIAGTTREPIVENIKFYQENIQLADMPGVRRKRGVNEPLEKLMVKSALHKAQDADIVLLLVDSSEGKLSDQELKLAFYVFELGKALIILFNKDDLVISYTRERLESSLVEYKHLMKKILSLNISCVSGKNIGKILPLVQKTWEKYNKKFSADELSLLFKEALNRRPLYHKTNLLILRFASQLKTAPITILLKVNNPDWFEESQLGYFENVLRKKYDLKGVPVKFVVRKK